MFLSMDGSAPTLIRPRFQPWLANLAIECLAKSEFIISLPAIYERRIPLEVMLQQNWAHACWQMSQERVAARRSGVSHDLVNIAQSLMGWPGRGLSVLWAFLWTSKAPLLN